MKNTRQLRVSPSLIKATVYAAILAVSLIILAISRANEAFATNIMRPAATWMLGVLSWIFSPFNFSIFELLIALLVVGVLVSLVTLVVSLIRGRGRRLGIIGSYLSSYFSLAAWILSVFILLFGCSYSATSKTESLGLEVKERGKEELYSLCSTLAEEANKASAGLESRDSVPSKEIILEYSEDVASIVGEYNGKKTAKPKYMLSSKYMSYTNITGIFSPFTGEANINTNDIAVAIPFSMAHELMHRNGVTAENDANFFAFVSLYEKGDGIYRYSSLFMGLLYSLPKLRSADAELYNGVLATLDEDVLADIAAYNAHWAQYEGKVAETSSKINNTYLMTQGETDGVKSYGKVVDLLLAYFAE